MEQEFKFYREPDTDINWGTIGLALLFWGVMGCAIGLYYDQVVFQQNYQIITKEQYRPYDNIQPKPTSVNQQPEHQLGPIEVNYPGEVYEIDMSGGLPTNHWTFIEIEITDNFDNFLFSIGKELYHETGYDSDGQWTEYVNHNQTKITFPEPGLYYLNFYSDSKVRKRTTHLSVKMKRYRGSSVAFYSLGVVLGIVGLLMIEIKYRPFRTVLEVIDND